MSGPVIDTKQGKIVGRIVSVNEELTAQKSVKFSGIPFAKCQRFRKPTPYGRWEGTRDATGICYNL